MRRQRDDENGRAVREVLESRGLTYRAADHKTGVNYNTVSRMAMGYTPEMESVVKFASGLGLDVNEWLTRYGYEAQEPTGAEVLMAGIARLAAELGRPIRIAFDESTKSKLTTAEAEQTLAVYRQQATDGLI